MFKVLIRIWDRFSFLFLYTLILFPPLVCFCLLSCVLNKITTTSSCGCLPLYLYLAVAFVMWNAACSEWLFLQNRHPPLRLAVSASHSVSSPEVSDPLHTHIKAQLKWQLTALLALFFRFQNIALVTVFLACDIQMWRRGWTFALYVARTFISICTCRLLINKVGCDIVLVIWDVSIYFTGYFIYRFVDRCNLF